MGLNLDDYQNESTWISAVRGIQSSEAGPTRTSASGRTTPPAGLTTYTISNIMQGMTFYKPKGQTLDIFNQTLSKDLEGLKAETDPKFGYHEKTQLSPYDLFIGAPSKNGLASLVTNTAAVPTVAGSAIADQVQNTTPAAPAVGGILPGYEQQIVVGAGLDVTPGRPKFVLHTTESGPGSLQGLISHWQGNWGSGLPHFIIEGTRCVQLLPINVGAYTLENKDGGTDTNRSGPAVQCEVVSFAANDWDDATYETVGKMLADVKKAGHDFDLGVHPPLLGTDAGFTIADYNSRQRMSADEYTNFNGWCAHQHVPENAHWDIGKKDGARIEAIARKYYGS